MKHIRAACAFLLVLAELKGVIGGGLQAAADADADADAGLVERATTQLRKRAECGPGIGSCDPGRCCSESGFCGTTAAYCGGSGCQLDYSDSCDTFFPPPGASTESVPRPRIGNVPYGSIITRCISPEMIALSFDDGPYLYTTQLLDILDSFNLKATFFVAGNNRAKGRIDNPNLAWPAILRRMHAAGHHIASHTWTHRNLNQVNSTVRRTEIVYNEMALRNLFGWIPTYMRPPYLECSAGSGCQALMNSLGYHVVNVNIDTKDFEFNDAALIQQAKDRFDNAVSLVPASNDYIVLAHDVQYQTVVNLTAHMINTARDRGYRLVTVGECLGDPVENWYRTAPRDGSAESSTSLSSLSSSSSSSSLSSSLSSSTTSNRSVSSASTSANPAATTPNLVSISSPTGRALSTTTSSVLVLPTTGVTISPNQRCGGDTGFTCMGSRYGNCCSHYGYCGSSPTYCGTGCDVDFGACDPKPPGTLDTTNGLCGSAFSASCRNYGSSRCCSQAGFCGNTSGHCGRGCQAGFGVCN